MCSSQTLLPMGGGGSSGLTQDLGEITPLHANPKRQPGEAPSLVGVDFDFLQGFSVSPLITIIFTSNAKGLLGIEPRGCKCQI